jgi:hypothetical protein
MSPINRCVVLVPAIHYVEPHCEHSLRQLEAMGYVVRRLFGFSQIDVARNRLVADALEEGFERLMWIDADIAFLPTSVDRLRMHDLPIVGGIYAKKIEKHFASHFLPTQEKVVFGEAGEIIEILYAAGGFLMVHRQVYLDVQSQQNLPVCNRRLGHPVVPYYLPMIISDGDEHRYLGEDFAFCERVRRCGYHIYADTTIRLQHIGMYGYSWEDVAGGLAHPPSYQITLQPPRTTQGSV